MSNLDKLDPKEALAAACEGSNRKLVNSLIPRDVQIDTNVAFSAIKGGDTYIISKVLKKSRNLPNVKGRSKQKESETTNIFQEACLLGNLCVLKLCNCSYGVVASTVINENDLLYFGIQGHSLQIVKFCVENSADLNKRYGTFQETVLHTACTEGNIDIIEYLIDVMPSLIHATDTEKYTPLFHAVARGHLDIVHLFIKKGTDVMAKGKHGRTILHLACWRGQKEMTSFIFNHYPQLISINNDRGTKVIHYAALGGSIKLLDHLVCLGLNVNAFDNGKNSILHKACETPNNDEMVEHLTKKYPKLKYHLNERGESALHRAASGGSIRVIEHLISEGLDVNKCDNNGYNVLHLACLRAPTDKKLSLVKHLIENYSSLQHVRTTLGASELHYAARGGSVDVLEYILGLGYDVSDKGAGGETILHCACREADNENMVIHLLQKYPELKHQLTVNCESALHFAVYGGSIQFIEHLISGGLNVNQCDNKGANILHLACLRAPTEKMLSLVQYLTINERFSSLQHVRDMFGATVLHYAAHGGSIDVLEYLVGIGYNINDTDTDGETVLHSACQKANNEDMVRHLTQKYADLKHNLTVDGKSALHMAVEGGSIPVIEHLISEGLDVFECTNDGFNIFHLAKHSSSTDDKSELVKYLVGRFPTLK